MKNPCISRATAQVAFLVSMACWAGSLPALAAEAPVTECDRQAAHSQDYQRVDGVPGILELRRVDVPAALAACEEAVARYPDSGRLKYQLARAILAETIETSHRDCQPVLALLEAAVEQGHAEAATELAVCHRIGWGIVKDLQKGTEWARKGYELGSPTAKAMLAKSIAFGSDGYRRDTVQGLAVLEKLAKEGNVEALKFMSFLYRTGTMKEQNLKRFFAYLLAAAERGDREAQSTVGRLLLRGKTGAPYDPELGWEMLRRAAEAGDFKAISELRKLYASQPPPEPQEQSRLPHGKPAK